MTLYYCNAHGRGPGADPAEVCPECYAAQRAARGADRKALRFRRADTVRVVTTDYIASLPPEAVEIPRPVVVAHPALGPRIAGIDPGARFVAVTIADGDGSAVRFVAAHTFEVGHAVERKTPTRRDGKPHASPERWVVDEDDVRALWAKLAPFITAHGVTAVCVERAKILRGAGEGGGYAASILTAQWVAGLLEGCLMYGGMPVTSCSSAEWRARAKKLTRAKKATPWVDALRGRYAGSLPPALDVHELDAAGVAAYLLAPGAPALDAPEPRAPRPAAPTRTQRFVAKRTAARNAKRAAIGCTCNGRRYHAVDCPANPANQPTA